MSACNFCLYLHVSDFLDLGFYTCNLFLNEPKSVTTETIMCAWKDFFSKFLYSNFIFKSLTVSALFNFINTVLYIFFRLIHNVKSQAPKNSYNFQFLFKTQQKIKLKNISAKNIYVYIYFFKNQVSSAAALLGCW